ncbi:MAG: hypothetical protein ACJAVM_002213 [Sulfitobacter sp.]
MYDIEHCNIARPSGDSFNAARQKYSVGGILGSCDRRGCYRVHRITYWQRQRACALGAGPSVAHGNRQPIPPRIVSACHLRKCQSPCRCTVGNGGRTALQGAILRDWRDLGRPTCLEFHRDQTISDAGRDEQPAVLAGSTCSLSQSECGPGSLAHCLASFFSASARPTGPRCAALACGIIPLTYAIPRHMGGQL